MLRACEIKERYTKCVQAVAKEGNFIGLFIISNTEAVRNHTQQQLCHVHHSTKSTVQLFAESQDATHGHTRYRLDWPVRAAKHVCVLMGTQPVRQNQLRNQSRQLTTKYELNSERTNYQFSRTVPFPPIPQSCHQPSCTERSPFDIADIKSSYLYRYKHLRA